MKATTNAFVNAYLHSTKSNLSHSHFPFLDASESRETHKLTKKCRETNKKDFKVAELTGEILIGQSK
jgi:hypothetical protein